MHSPGREPRVKDEIKNGSPRRGRQSWCCVRRCCQRHVICRRTAAFLVFIAPFPGLTPRALNLPVLRGSSQASRSTKLLQHSH